jgi:hypothetical protein
MAVRLFDPSESHRARLTVVPVVTPRRRELRRTRHRYAVLGAASVAVPFLVALIALGVVH